MDKKDLINPVEFAGKRNMSMEESIKNHNDIEVIVKCDDNDDDIGVAYVFKRDDGVYETNLYSIRLTPNMIDDELSNDEISDALGFKNVYYEESENTLDGINKVFEYWNMEELEELPDTIDIFDSYIYAVEYMKGNDMKYLLFLLSDHLRKIELVGEDD